MKGREGGKGKGAAGMEYGSGGGGGGGGRGGVQPPSAGARGMAGTDTTDAAWHKHEQMILMESRHKQQCKYTHQNYDILVFFILSSFRFVNIFQEYQFDGH